MDKDLQTRLKSGIIYVSLMIGVTFHPWALALASGILCAGCIYEYLKINGYALNIRIAGAISGICIAPFPAFPHQWIFPFFSGVIIAGGLVFFMAAQWRHGWITMLGLIYILFPFCCWTAIPQHDIILDGKISAFILIAMMGVTWTHDSMAYVTGRWLGKTPLAPSISPKKTWEGSLGGLLFAIIAACALMGNISTSIVIWGLFTGLGALLGDLAESKFKRWKGVKDSGNVLPGHGGFLDRLDAMLWTAPITYFMLPWL